MATRDPGELIRAYLQAIEVTVVAGGEAAVARLGTIGATVAQGVRVVGLRASDELDALLEGRALDLAAPGGSPLVDAAARGLGWTADLALDALRSWQAMVVDWLLRGTVAPLGHLGLLCVQDDLKTSRDGLSGELVADITGQSIGFRPSPQLTAAVNGAPPPPPVDPVALAAILQRHREPPIDVATTAAMLEHLGFAAGAAPAGAPPPLLGELIRRCAGAPLGTLRVLAGPGEVEQVDDTAVPFAVDQHEGHVWAYCTRSGDDPGVIANPERGGHVCALHRTTLSGWLTARLLAVELDTLAPAAMPEDALAAIAAELEPFGRIGGELAQALWRHPRWMTAPPRRPRTTPPPPPPPPPLARAASPPLNEQVQAASYRDHALVIAPSGLELQLASGPGFDVLAHESQRAGTRYKVLAIPAARLQDAQVAQLHGAGWLRLLGCFHGLHQDWQQDGVVLDVGPLPTATAEAASRRLREALGLPRRYEALDSTASLIGQYTRRWVEVPGVWNPAVFDRPGFDGVYLHLPIGQKMPGAGTRLRVRGVFEGPRRPPPGPKAKGPARIADPGTLYVQQWWKA